MATWPRQQNPDCKGSGPKQRTPVLIWGFCSYDILETEAPLTGVSPQRENRPLLRSVKMNFGGAGREWSEGVQVAPSLSPAATDLRPWWWPGAPLGFFPSPPEEYRAGVTQGLEPPA